MTAQALLLKAISLPNVPLPKVDSRGSVALKPLYPMRGPAAEPAPDVEISFPQAEAGQEIAKTATAFKGINLAEGIRTASLLSVKSRAEKLAKQPMAEKAPDTHETEALPEVPVMGAGPITMAIDRSRSHRWGR